MKLGNFPKNQRNTGNLKLNSIPVFNLMKNQPLIKKHSSQLYYQDFHLNTLLNNNAKTKTKLY